jgi:hypothetical protein
MEYSASVPFAYKTFHPRISVKTRKMHCCDNSNTCSDATTTSTPSNKKRIIPSKSDSTAPYSPPSVGKRQKVSLNNRCCYHHCPFSSGRISAPTRIIPAFTLLSFVLNLQQSLSPDAATSEYHTTSTTTRTDLKEQNEEMEVE